MFLCRFYSFCSFPFLSFFSSFHSCFVLVCLFVVLFFFFKQKTAYEMRISDWSSDVCSSDLVFLVDRIGRILLLHLRQHELHEIARIERGKRSFGRGRGTRRRACRGYGSDGHFILIVSSISC